MRLFAGSLLTVFFIGTFFLLFTQTSRELSSAQTLHEVLDENIRFTEIDLPANSVMTDRNGSIISDIYSDQNRVFIEYDDIPQTMIDLFIAVEDKLFYEHEGFDVSGIARALIINLQSDGIEQGASTITQQVARNLYLSHEQSYERKITELLYAYQLEREMSKEDILELYINTIYFANGVYGFEAASQYYFSKSVYDLTLAETAFLGAIPNNPTIYNPLTNEENTHSRKEFMLNRMVNEGFISVEERDTALQESIVFSSKDKVDEYPDYVTYIYHELDALIAESEGYKEQLKQATTSEAREAINETIRERRQAILRAGVTIETALDQQIQRHLVTTINNRLNGSPVEAAASVIDHQSNEIVALTGGKNYRKFDFHRGYQAKRQPGSAIKPLLSFAPYIEATGQTRTSIVDAGPFSRNGYSPTNFGGGVYGLVTMEQAFVQSYNTAAVRMLDSIGIERGFSYINQFDFSSIGNDDYRLPAALGGFTTGMSVNEMTQAYTVFQTEGNYLSPRAIKRVVDLEGNELYSWSKSPKAVYSQETATQIKRMMQENVNRGTGREAGRGVTGYVGGKTGTTNTYHDLWFVGATESHTVGLWIGQDQPTPLQSESSGQLHTRLWNQLVRGF